MKENTKRFISIALAGSIVAGANISNAYAEEEKIVEEVKPVELKETKDLTYIINKGDTLTGISLIFFGDIKYYKDIAKYNNIEEPYTIYEGQELKIPRTISEILYIEPKKEYENDKIHIVKKTDYLLKIVEKYYGITNNNIELVNKLATYNELEDPNIITIGQVLYIPEILKLKSIEEKDYSLQYKRLEWRINNPGELYPLELQEKDNEKELVLIK